MDTETMALRKKQLRRRLRDQRARVYGGAAGAELRAAQSGALITHAAPLIALLRELAAAAAETGGPAPLVAAYRPTPTEADVMPLAALLAETGARLVFPAAAAAGAELEWILWDGRSPFRPSPGRGFGEEPEGPRLGTRALEEAALVLVPAVAVDRSGTRIGHGAGYYDRALTTVPPGARVVAVIHPQELLEAGSLPRGEFDVPIPEILTADGHVHLVTSPTG